MNLEPKQQRLTWFLKENYLDGDDFSGVPSGESCECSHNQAAACCHHPLDGNEEKEASNPAAAAEWAPGIGELVTLTANPQVVGIIRHILCKKKKAAAAAAAAAATNVHAVVQKKFIVILSAVDNDDLVVTKVCAIEDIRPASLVQKNKRIGTPGHLVFSDEPYYRVRLLGQNKSTALLGTTIPALPPSELVPEQDQGNGAVVYVKFDERDNVICCNIGARDLYELVYVQQKSLSPVAGQLVCFSCALPFHRVQHSLSGRKGTIIAVERNSVQIVLDAEQQDEQQQQQQQQQQQCEPMPPNVLLVNWRSCEDSSHIFTFREDSSSWVTPLCYQSLTLPPTRLESAAQGVGREDVSSSCSSFWGLRVLTTTTLYHKPKEKWRKPKYGTLLGATVKTAVSLSPPTYSTSTAPTPAPTPASACNSTLLLIWWDEAQMRIPFIDQIEKVPLKRAAANMRFASSELLLGCREGPRSLRFSPGQVVTKFTIQIGQRVVNGGPHFQSTHGAYAKGTILSYTLGSNANPVDTATILFDTNAWPVTCKIGGGASPLFELTYTDQNWQKRIGPTHGQAVTSGVLGAQVVRCFAELNNGKNHGTIFQVNNNHSIRIIWHETETVEIVLYKSLPDNLRFVVL